MLCQAQSSNRGFVIGFNDATLQFKATNQLEMVASLYTLHKLAASLGDTLEPELTQVCDTNPKELIGKFMEELERRGKNMRTLVREEVHARRYSTVHSKAN